jgi:hypothetical protein
MRLMAEPVIVTRCTGSAVWSSAIVHCDPDKSPPKAKAWATMIEDLFLIILIFFPF